MLVDPQSQTCVKGELEGDVMRLPKIPYVMNKNKSQTVPLGNINFCAATSDGDLVDSCGISARKFPYMTTRGALDELPFENALEKRVTDIYAFYGTVCVCGDELYWIKTVDGEKQTYNLGTVEHGKRQFIPINTKLVILPDKVYLDSTEECPALHDLGASKEAGTLYVPIDNTKTLIGYPNSLWEFYAERIYINGRFQADEFIPMHPETVVGGDYNYAVRNEYGTSFTRVEHLGKTKITPIFNKDNPQASNGGYEYELYGRINIEDEYLNRSFFFQRDQELFSAKYIKSGEKETCYIFDSPAFISDSEIDLYVEEPDWWPNDIDTQLMCEMCAFTFGDAERKNAYIAQYTQGKIHFSLPNTAESGTWIAPLEVLSFRKIKEGDDEYRAIQVMPKSDRYFRFSCPTSINNEFCAIGNVSEYKIRIKNQFLLDENIHYVVIYYMDRECDTINFTDLFKVGDTVVAKSSIKDFGEKTFTITALTPGSMSTSADIFTPGDYPDMTIERRFPDLDFACECHNRLFGCSNADKTIYVSALGDPTNMMTYEGVSTDSFAVAVAGEGDFTACCAHDSSVLFWKENKLHKLTGYTPADFALYTYQVDGVQAGSSASTQIINEVLYYKGVSGVFAYTGGIPQLISPNFGARKFRGAVGGSDGDTYYISMSDADGDYLFAYETRSNMWVLEDKIKCDAFVRSDGSLKYVSDGKVYELTGGDTPRDHEWFMQLAPLYETMEGKKTYSRILLRVELPIGSYIIASVRMDGGRWLETGKIVGKTDNVVPIRIPVNRCDKFELKLSGRGPCTILGIMREYYVGGDV